MRIGVPKEITPDERRVALVPDTAQRLLKAGAEIVVEAGAGEGACFPDADYQSAGAQVTPGPEAAFQADVVLKVQKPRRNDALGRHEVELLKPGAVLIGFLQPLQDLELAARIAERGVTSFALELLPRISRAQKMDALSSMSTVAGYKAVLLGAAAVPRFFPLLMTAAGTIAPARVLVIGAGVAGLQAIATARRLGAVVEAFDLRPKVKEEVQSLGGTFVTVAGEALEGEGGYAREAGEELLRREREALSAPVRQADLVVATAMVPGKPAPKLITAEMLTGMKPGSMIVDLAAEMGGNCELTEPGREVMRGNVRVLGAINLASTMADHASRMYSRNLAAFLSLIVKDNALHLDWGDEIVAKSCVSHDGKVRVEGAPQPTVAEKGTS